MSYDPSRLYRHDELTGLIHEWCERFPHLLQLRSLGQSPQGRELWLLVLTHHPSGPADKRPACWVDGNTHAAELAGSAAALHVAWTLLTGYGTDEAITRLLERTTVYVLPRLSPDGAEHCLVTNDFIRSTPRPYPAAGPHVGLWPQDVNGDGLVLQMRMASPRGEWKVSSQDARILIRRQPDDHEGPFYHVYREGRLDNWDGGRIEVPPPPCGMDFNRNYPFEWAPEHQQKGAGPYPLSEPETRAVVDFLATHRNVSIVHTFHTYSAVILRPYSTRPDTDLPDLDVAVYRQLGARGTALTGYPCVSTYHDFRYHPKESIKGGFDDWCYDHQGIFSFTTELWSIGKAAGLPITDHIKFLNERTEAETLAILRFNDEAHLDGFVPWTPFEHPQLGPVEIGGWKLLQVWQNPPARYLADICTRAARWVLATATALPHLCIERFEAEELGAGLCKLTLEVANHGWLPTPGSARALDAGLVPKPAVELTLAAGTELVMGRARTEIPHLSGVANVVADGPDSPVYFRGVTQSGRERLEWLVRGSGEVQVTVSCERAGTCRASVVAVRGGKEHHEQRE